MTKDEDYDILSQKHLASIKRDTRISFEDAAVRAIHKMLEPEQEPVARHSDIVSNGGLDPLYTSPPKREWVGLSAKDVDEITDDAISIVDSMLLTEAKLKGLNT